MQGQGPQGGSPPCRDLKRVPTSQGQHPRGKATAVQGCHPRGESPRHRDIIYKEGPPLCRDSAHKMRSPLRKDITHGRVPRVQGQHP